MKTDDKIFVTGHLGMVGSAMVRRLSAEGFTRIITATRDKLDMRNQTAVEEFLDSERPEFLFMSAAKVGGIFANSNYPAEFIRDNLAIQTNVIHAAWRAGVKKLLFLGSSCIYPRLAPQPIKEDALLSGPLESTNVWYAVAKIAGVKMCQAYRQQYGFDAISLMPTNLYGPGDNFNPQNSHVIPALLTKFHEAKIRGDDEVTIWGTGKARREFMHVDDLADACVFLMHHYSDDEPINVGIGEDIELLDLALLIAEIVGYKARIVTDPSKPDGTPRKLLDVSKLNSIGWRARILLADGLESTYEWLQDHEHDLRLN